LEGSIVFEVQVLVIVEVEDRAAHVEAALGSLVRLGRVAPHEMPRIMQVHVLVAVVVTLGVEGD
jgi:hypothetical protein